MYRITKLERDAHDREIATGELEPPAEKLCPCGRAVPHTPAAATLLDESSRQPPPETFASIFRAYASCLDGAGAYLSRHWRRTLVDSVVFVTVVLLVADFFAALAALAK